MSSLLPVTAATVHVTAEKQSLLAPWLDLGRCRARGRRSGPRATAAACAGAGMPGCGGSACTIHVAVQAVADRPLRGAVEWPARARAAGGPDRQRRRARPGVHRTLARPGVAAATAGPFRPTRFQPAGRRCCKARRSTSGRTPRFRTLLQPAACRSSRSSAPPIRCAGRPGRRAPVPRNCSRVRRPCSGRAMSRCCKAAWPVFPAAGPAARTTGKAAATAWWTSSPSGCWTRPCASSATTGRRHSPRHVQCGAVAPGLPDFTG